MKKSAILILIVFALFIGLVSGFYLSGFSKAPLFSSLSKTEKSKMGNFENNFAGGWAAARQKLTSFNPAMNSAFSLGGQVKEIKGKEISFETNLINPLDDESLKIRSAVIDSNTQITVWKLKSSEQVKKDSEEAQVKIASLQNEIAGLNSEIEACGSGISEKAGGQSEECKAARAKYENINAEINKENEKMDSFEKGELKDAKAGWYIIAVAPLKKEGDKKENASPVEIIANQYENIASEKKFTASSIEIREARSLPLLVGN